MFSSGRKASGGGASAILTTAIGVYLGGSQHPHWSMALYVCAVIAALYALLQWRLMRRFVGIDTSSLDDDASDKNSSVHANNSGGSPQIAAANSTFHGPIDQSTTHHHYGQPRPPKIKDMSQNALAALPEPSFPMS